MILSNINVKLALNKGSLLTMVCSLFVSFLRTLRFILYYKTNKKRRNATKPGFQRFHQKLIWQK